MRDDNIYIGHQTKSNVGVLLAALAVLAIIAGIVFLVLRLRSSKPEPAEVESAGAAQPAAIDRGLSLLTAAAQLQKEGKLLEARDKAYEVLAQSSNSAARAGAETMLGEVNVELVLTPFAMPEKVEYTIQPGDSINALAKKFGTTVEIVQKGNRVTGSVIRPGDRLRIFTGKFSIQVSKKDNSLVLLMNDKFFKRYAVGTGEYGKTPVGDFTIRDRVPQPTWWKDGKAIPYGDTNNVLGTHWLALDVPGYGIHGTWQPDTIGKQASAGCIRLVNAEIEELFTLVPVGTPVTITE
jgi:lipoprotein-anchoring transpeptidase ErfK/SrfK